MNVRQMPLEDLELLSYTDIAYELLKLDKKSKKTNDLFKEVCNLLQISEDNMLDMIGDFYTTLTTDKRFILLEDGTWDLRNRHTSDKVIKVMDEEDDEEEELEEETEEEFEEEQEDFDSALNDEDDLDDEDDDLKDLVVLDEDEMEIEQ